MRGGVGVNGGHKTFSDTESFLEENVDDRRKAVSRATCVRDDVMLGRIVEVVIHTDDEGGVFALRRSGDDDLLGTSGDVALGFFSFGEKAGGFDDDFDTEFFPWQTFRAARAHDFDVVAVDDDDVVILKLRGGFLRRNRPGETTLSRVIFQKIGEVVCWNDVTYGDDVEGGPKVALFDEGTEDKAADAAESVDCNSGHNSMCEDRCGSSARRAGLCMRMRKRQPYDSIS